MAKQIQSKKLKEKTEQVLAEVQASDQKSQSVIDVLRRTEAVMAEADTAEAVKSRMNIEKAELRDVIGEKARLQQTVGALIAGYDALTNALGGQIDSLKDKTMWESVIGLFSEKKARDLRENRIQTADIDTQLQDLVAQTQAINKLLSDHLTTLNEEYSSVKGMLDHQQSALQVSTSKFETSDKRLEELNLQISEKREVLAELTGTERIEADQALQKLVNEANDMTEQRNTALSNAQTHELFVENHKIALDSLLRQKAAQRVLIDKLRISTENRIIQYSATVESLRTAAQQESAHTIEEIGTQVDQETSRTMAGIGAAADRRIVDMLEKHAVDIQKRRATQTEIARADAEFARRFAEVAQEFLKDAYEERR
jgi:dsDNA-binding SOS-regulon protein